MGNQKIFVGLNSQAFEFIAKPKLCFHICSRCGLQEDQARTRKRSTGYLEVIGGLSRDHQKLLHVYVKKGEEDVLRELLSRPDVDVNGLDEHNQGENRFLE